MAWEWSHTVEAYQDARENLHALPDETIREIADEWGLPDGVEAEYLADAIWERMEEQRLCDNGGFNAWACPHGCHTVSFDAGVSDVDVR